MKLTASGNLPVKIVKELYSEKIITEEFIEDGTKKLLKESDSESIQYAKIIGTLSGIFRKSRNHLHVTKSGRRFENQKDNFAKIFNTFGIKFNLGYSDGFENDQIAQLGFKYSVYLLKKYGNETRASDFYAEKYFQAFPDIAEGNSEDISCYYLRTFTRFFNYFGIIEMIGTCRDRKVIKTALFDKYIEISV